MKFVIGLGNFDQKYNDTRHNIGFEVAGILAQNLATGSKFLHNKKLQAEIIKAGDLILAKPRTFMNQSGRAVRAILDYYEKRNFKKGEKLELKNLFVIHDDLDLELGTYKIQLGKGPKVHNGLLSIYEHLGTQLFWHVRIGIDGRGENRSIPGGNYVLAKFSPSEKGIITKISAQASAELQNLILDLVLE